MTNPLGRIFSGLEERTLIKNINSKRTPDPNAARYRPLFIPKNANFAIEDVFKMNCLKMALELDLADAEDQPLEKISKKSKSGKGTTDAVSKVCFCTKFEA